MTLITTNHRNMAYYPQQCDSYFVECDGDRGRRYRDLIREEERQAKRSVQVAIAEHLSNVDSNEYRSDHLRAMEKMEVSAQKQKAFAWPLSSCRHQLETLPDVANIDIQTEIQWYMRPYLLDFLIEANTAFGLLPETLFLTINVLDRYCSRRIVYKKHYQLVGCSALLIASKYGDRKDRVPTIRELKGMCCGLYEDNMFTQLEWHVLQTLNWAIGHPSIDNFLQLAVEHVQYDPEVEHMANYISEMALFQKEFVSKRPSNMARASLALARCILNRPQELNTVWAGQFDSQTLVALSQELHRPSAILSRKYASAPLSRVSITLDDFVTQQAALSKFNNTPPTPPAVDTCSDVFEKSGYGQGPATADKKANVPSYNNGCPTPPDTPTNQEYFSKPVPMRTQYPPTPSSIPQHTFNPQVTLPPFSTFAARSCTAVY